MQTLSSGPVNSSVHNFINSPLHKSLVWLENCVQAEVFLLKKKPHFLVIRQGMFSSFLWKLKVEVACLRWILQVLARLQKQFQEKQLPATPNQHSSVGKQFHTNSSLATARSEILALLKKKRLLPWISVQPNFLSRSFESLSHSWLPRSCSSTEWALAGGCCWNCGFPHLPAAFPQPELLWAAAAAGCSAETFPGQERGFSGWCALPICSLAAGDPAQLSVLLNTPSGGFSRKFCYLTDCKGKQTAHCSAQWLRHKRMSSWQGILAGFMLANSRITQWLFIHFSARELVGARPRKSTSLLLLSALHGVRISDQLCRYQTEFF